MPLDSITRALNTAHSMARRYRAEGGPVPTDAGRVDLMPEPPGDIQAQLVALADPNNPKDSVFLPRGSVVPEDLPPGVIVRQRPEGVLITRNASKAALFEQAPPNDERALAYILGYPETKQDAAASESPRVVQGKDDDGNVVYESAVSPSTQGVAEDMASKQAPNVETVSVEDAIKRREDLRDNRDEEAAARGGALRRRADGGQTLTFNPNRRWTDEDEAEYVRDIERADVPDNVKEYMRDAESFTDDHPIRTMRPDAQRDAMDYEEEIAKGRPERDDALNSAMWAGFEKRQRNQPQGYAEGGPSGSSSGLLESGNIDLANRPIVKNPDGSISTVRSMSFNDNGAEVLIPTVAANGSGILSDRAAIEQYRKTGQFLGKFDTPENATAYAEKLHQSQAKQYRPQGYAEGGGAEEEPEQSFEMAANEPPGGYVEPPKSNPPSPPRAPLPAGAVWAAPPSDATPEKRERAPLPSGAVEQKRAPLPTGAVLVDQKPGKLEPGKLESALHGAEEGLLPGLVGLGGIGAGAAIGSAFGPIGTIAGGALGGIGAGAAGAYGQRALLDTFPSAAKWFGLDKETREAEEQAHPYYRQAGELAGSAVGLRPSLRSLQLGQRLIGAGLTGGIDAAKQAYNGERDLPKLGMSTAFGALFPSFNRTGEKVAALGAAPVRMARGLPAFPEAAASPPPPGTSGKTPEELAAITKAQADVDGLTSALEGAKGTPLEKIAADKLQAAQRNLQALTLAESPEKLAENMNKAKVEIDALKAGLENVKDTGAADLLRVHINRAQTRYDLNKTLLDQIRPEMLGQNPEGRTDIARTEQDAAADNAKAAIVREGEKQARDLTEGNLPLKGEADQSPREFTEEERARGLELLMGQRMPTQGRISLEGAAAPEPLVWDEATAKAAFDHINSERRGQGKIALEGEAPGAEEFTEQQLENARQILLRRGMADAERAQAQKSMTLEGEAPKPVPFTPEEIAAGQMLAAAQRAAAKPAQTEAGLSGEAPKTAPPVTPEAMAIARKALAQAREEFARQWQSRLPVEQTQTPGAEKPVEAPATDVDANGVALGEGYTERERKAFWQRRRADQQNTPYMTVPREPERIISFLRKMGGVDDVGGNISKIVGGPRGRPGLINSNGVSLEHATKRVQEAGFFHDMATPRAGGEYASKAKEAQPNDLYTLIEQDVKTAPAYSIFDEADLSAYRHAMDYNEQVHRYATEYDIPDNLPPEEFNRRLAEKLDAAEKETIDTEAEHLDGVGRQAAEEEDIPWDPLPPIQDIERARSSESASGLVEGEANHPEPAGVRGTEGAGEAVPGQARPASEATGNGTEATTPVVAPPVSVQGPDWIREAAGRFWARGSRLGIVSDIERLSAEQKTANQIVNELGDKLTTVPQEDRLNLVRSVRNQLGIPSMDQTTEYAQWLDKYRQRPASAAAGQEARYAQARELVTTTGIGEKISANTFDTQTLNRLIEEGILSPRAFKGDYTVLRTEPREGFGLTQTEAAPAKEVLPASLERTDQGIQQVMPGMERSAQQAAAAREAQGQGALRSDTAQEEPGGMFETPKNDTQATLPTPKDEEDLSHIPVPFNKKSEVVANPAYETKTDDFIGFLQDGRYPQTPEGVTLAARDWLILKGEHTGDEHAVVIGTDGRPVLATTSNDPLYVSWSHPDQNNPDAAMVMHHNHPIELSLSGPDVSILGLYGIHTVVAHGPDGLYTVRLTDAVDAWTLANLDNLPRKLAAMENVNALQKIHDSVGRVVDQALETAEKAGEIGPEDRWPLYADLTNRALDAAGIVEYRGPYGTIPLSEAAARSIVNRGAQTAVGNARKFGLQLDAREINARLDKSTKPVSVADSLAAISREHAEGVAKLREGVNRTDADRGADQSRPTEPEAEAVSLFNAQRPDPDNPVQKMRGMLGRVGRYDANANKLEKNIEDVMRSVVPMATGTPRAQNTVSIFANSLRSARAMRVYFTDKLDSLPHAEMKNMWETMSQASVKAQLEGDAAGEAIIDTLPAKQQAVAREMEEYSTQVWDTARALGIVAPEAVRIPWYTPRMAVKLAKSGASEPLRIDPNTPGGSLDRMGTNLSTAGPKYRHYLTPDETEAALKAKDPDAQIVRDIRTLPLALERLERAIVGRKLVNDIREIGQKTGAETVIEGQKRPGYFTLDHPALQMPVARRNKAGEVLRDEHNNIIWDSTPLYISNEFKGPLKAVLNSAPGAVENAFYAVKGGAMSLIMFSPLMHNMVIYGKALPVLPYKNPLLSWMNYVEGHRYRQDASNMVQMTNDGVVPIAHRGYRQELTALNDEPNVTAGKSLPSKGAKWAVSNLINPEAGTLVARGIDKMGSILHETLLWNRIADLQAVIYRDMREGIINGQYTGGKPVDPLVAGKIAGHFANRYAGILPPETMSHAANLLANLTLFSKTFTLTNLGTFKDMINGLPRNVQAQISEPMGEIAKQIGTSIARRKAWAAFAVDMGMFYAINAIGQYAFDRLVRSKSNNEIEQAYIERATHAYEQVREHPADRLLTPTGLFGTINSLFPQGSNEPGKKDRVLMGESDKDPGTAVYGRIPFGKVSEDLIGWLTHPAEMFERKRSTLLKPTMEFITNDKGFGHMLYKKNPQTLEDLADNTGRVIMNFVSSQIPWQFLVDAYHAASGEEKTKFGIAKAVGPVLGFSVSRGAPGYLGGPRYSFYKEKDDANTFEKLDRLPDAMKLYRDGKVDEAIALMRKLNMSTPSIKTQIQRWEGTARTGLSKSNEKKLNKEMTPDERYDYEHLNMP